MNCSTLVPEEHYVEKENSRRTSRGLASCLRGESDEYYEAEGKYFFFIKNVLTVLTAAERKNHFEIDQTFYLYSTI